MRFPTLVRDGRQRPIVAVSILLPGQPAVLFDALLDTGADITLFPKSIADRLAINLEAEPVASVFAAVGGMCQYRLHSVELELRRAPDVFRWKASVGFVEREMSFGILGTRGFMEFFDLAYSASDKAMSILPAGELFA